MSETKTQVTFGGTTPILPVSDLARSLEYYTNVLGFKVDWDSPGIIASISRGKTTLMLIQGDQGHPGTWVWIGVDDAAALFEEYLASGAIIRRPPTNYFWALEMQVEDPDSNVLRLCSDPIRDKGEPLSEWEDMRGNLWIGLPEGAPEGRWKTFEAKDAAQFYSENAKLCWDKKLRAENRWYLFKAAAALKKYGTKKELAAALRNLGEAERNLGLTAAGQKH